MRGAGLMATAPAGYVPQTLDSGTAKLNAAGVQSHLFALESNVPEESRMQLTLAVGSVLGRDVSGAIATLFNQTVNLTNFVGISGKPPPWPGAQQLATGGNHTVVIRWVKGQPQILAVIGILALLAIAGFIVLEIVTHWDFIHWILAPVAPGLLGGLTGGELILFGIGGLVAFLLIERVARGP